jgi:outer membrane autotransporter protein
VGLLAQSVGGGGGLSGMAVSTALGGGSGIGGTVSVTDSASVATSGLRAFGIVAQSVGGGGGFLSGGESLTNPAFATLSSGTGNGGSVTVHVGAAGSVVTSGVDADGIIAQSIGGGGGFAGAGTLLNAAGTGSGFAGTAGGAGVGGAVKVTVDGSVAALGGGGIGILAQSEGGTGYANGTVGIVIAQNALVEGGAAGGSAVEFLQGAGETLTNAGTITSIQGASGTAVTGNSGGIAITNTGTINGSILLEGSSDAPSTVRNLGGLIDAGKLIDLGTDGVFTNSAMLAPGGEKIVSTTTLTGNYVQTGKGRLLITVALRNNTADELAVSGTASLSGFIVPTWINPKAARPGPQQVTILSAAGGITTQGLDGRHLSTPSVTATLVQPNANDLALDYVVNFSAAPSFRAAGMGSANLLSVGGALQKIAGGEVPDALAPIMTSALNAPTAASLGAIYNGLSGEAAASTLQSAIGAIAQFQATVMGQLGRLAASPASFQVASASDAIPVPAQSGPVRLWATGFGNADTLDGSGGTATLTSSTGGGAAGLDVRLGPGLLAGLSAGASTTQYAIAGRASSGETNGGTGGFYGMWDTGPFYARGVVSYSHLSTSEQRVAPAGTRLDDETGHFGTDVFGGEAEIGWRRTLGSATVTPFAALQVTELWQGSFSEAERGMGGTAGPLALHVNGQATTSVPLTLGVQLDEAFALGTGGPVRPLLRAGWVHEFSPQRAVTENFIAAPDTPFRVLGVAAAADSALVEAGASLRLARGVTMDGEFVGQLSAVQKSLGGFGTVKMAW